MTKTAKISLLSLLILTSASFASAKFSIPNHVYSVAQLANALSIAKNSNKPLTFIYSDKNTDCSLATAASQDIFKNMQNQSIIIYAERNDWNSLPDIVKTGINAAESGNYIPKTVIVDSTLNRIICIIPYAEAKKRRQLIKQAQKLISSN
jgi:hypothetical protein